MPPKDEVIRRACLDYESWQRSNPEKLRQLLSAHPEIDRSDLYVASALGDVGAVRGALDRELALVNARGGFFRWEPSGPWFRRLGDRADSPKDDLVQDLC